MKLIDRLSAGLARIAAWLFFATGLMLGWEVMARYFFTAPTIWAEELSRLLLVWASFVGAAHLIHSRDHIRITIVIDLLGPPARRMCELVTLLLIAAFGVAVGVYGFEIAWDSFVRGRTTGSMLDIPTVWVQAAVPFGAALLTLQAAVEALRIARGCASNGQTGDKP